MLVFLVRLKREIMWNILFGGHPIKITVVSEMPLFLVKGDERSWGLNAMG